VGSSEYLDFIIRIERIGINNEYMAYIQSPVGHNSVNFSLPINPTELEQFRSWVSGARSSAQRDARPRSQPTASSVENIGSRLFDVLFTDDVQRRLQRSMDKAQDAHSRLRINICLDEGAPELANIPWEFLYSSRLNRFLVHSVDTPLIRSLDITKPVPTMRVELPLRILVVVSSPADQPPLNVEQEWKDLEHALAGIKHKVVLHRLSTPTLYALQQELSRCEYHILHFIGHGAFSEANQDGVLIFENDHGRSEEVDNRRLGAILYDHCNTLRLAIINACEGARSASNKPFSGTAQNLFAQGIPAVIAMQYKISDKAALMFAEQFYGALVLGEPVDTALYQARMAIYSKIGGPEWGTPVLYLRSPDGRIFNPQPPDPPKPPPPPVINNPGAHLQNQFASSLYEIEQAIQRSDWTTAMKSARTILHLDPNQALAAERLRYARQKECERLFGAGWQLYDQGRLQEALGPLKQLQALGGNYHNVAGLIDTIQRQVKQHSPYHKIEVLLTNKSIWIAVVVLLVICCVLGSK
jgi:CHAT domain-containing protein